jgi:FkbM family methyltransferase
MPGKGDPVRWLASVVTPGAVFIDGGANEGRMSQAARDLGATVYAVEPDPRCVEFLTKLGVTHIACALGRQTGAGQFYLGPSPAHSSRFAACVKGFERETIVPVIALDSIEDAAVIKLDLQGGEADAIRGAAHQLSVCRQWCVELWPHAFTQTGDDPAAFLDAFASHDLKPHWMEAGTPVETTYAEMLAYLQNAHAAHEHVNAVFAR